MRPASASMQEALEKAKHYGSLERRPGGYWTYPGCPMLNNYAPHWYVGRETVRGLVLRGSLIFTHYKRDATGLQFAVRAEPAPLGGA